MRAVVLVLGLAAAVLSAGELSETDRALLSAAGSGDAAAVRRALRRGANVNAALPSGWTALMEAARAGRLDAAQALLAAGADADARDRAAGTVLDVAQQAGQDAVVRLLRARGARGSGKSVGDRVCVRPWKGDGFCGRVAAAERTRLLVEVTSVLGCAEACAPDPDCSSGRAVGGVSADAVREAASVWIRSWCLTHTGLE